MLKEETGGATRGDASSMAEGAMTCLLPCSRSSEDEGSRGGRGRGQGGWTSAGLETGATTWIRRGGAWGGDAMEDGDEAEAKEKGGRASQALGVKLAREALRLEELGNRARGLLPGVLRVW